MDLRGQKSIQPVWTGIMKNTTPEILNCCFKTEFFSRMCSSFINQFVSSNSVPSPTCARILLDRVEHSVEHGVGVLWNSVFTTIFLRHLILEWFCDNNAISSSFRKFATFPSLFLSLSARRNQSFLFTVWLPDHRKLFYLSFRTNKRDPRIFKAHFIRCRTSSPFWCMILILLFKTQMDTVSLLLSW